MRWLDSWPLISSERLAPYLIRRCASGHRSGRRWKTRLRLGNWRDFSTESAEFCPCCNSKVNDIAHALFSCSAFGVNERVTFFDSVSQLGDDNFSSLSFSCAGTKYIKSGFSGRI